ncbi:MAG: thioredoxin domain-containing protein, partial [Candidatus Acidiferrales bacterium]
LTDAIVRMFDLRNGGFGRAPKFPHSSALDLLIEQYQSSRESHLLTVIETTLTRMARGGMYDQLAGGFHRYSVDEKWLVPHFEKMSYDNSELLKNYVHGWQATKNPFHRETAEGIIGWVNEVLSDQAAGGFYASQDADYSLEDDGDYFTWTLEELRAVLSADEARVIELYYDVEGHGEMHHNPAKNVLWIAREPGEIARQLALTEAAVRDTITRAKEKMLAARVRRPTPYIDTSLYTGWNAMLVSAYLDAARVFGREDCRDFALKTLARILREAWDHEKGFAHRFGGAAASNGWLHGSLDDQVFTVIALLDAYEATLDPGWIEHAERAMQIALAKYFDPQGGGFFDRSSDAPPLGGLEVRRKPFQDSPTPSANAAAAIALDRLYGFTGKSLYRERAEQTLEAFASAVPQYGLFAASYGLAAALHARHAIQVVITGATEDPLAAQLEQAAHGVYRFGKAVLRVTPAVPADALAPALKQTIPHLHADVPQALVCVETTCRPPITDPTQLAATLAGLSGAASAIAG